MVRGQLVCSSRCDRQRIGRRSGDDHSTPPDDPEFLPIPVVGPPIGPEQAVKICMLPKRTGSGEAGRRQGALWSDRYSFAWVCEIPMRHLSSGLLAQYLVNTRADVAGYDEGSLRGAK